MALEMARQVGTTYPSSLNVLVTMGVIQTIPTNPKGSAYLYTQGATGYTYTIGTSMEDLGSTTGLYGAYNYRVTNP
jgi:hypothetical protein